MGILDGNRGREEGMTRVITPLDDDLEVILGLDLDPDPDLEIDIEALIDEADEVDLELGPIHDLGLDLMIGDDEIDLILGLGLDLMIGTGLQEGLGGLRGMRREGVEGLVILRGLGAGLMIGTGDEKMK